MNWKRVLAVLGIVYIMAGGMVIVSGTSGEQDDYDLYEKSDLNGLEQLMKEVDRQWKTLSDETEMISFAEVVQIFMNGNPKEMIPEMGKEAICYAKQQWGIFKKGWFQIFLLGVVSSFFVNFSNGFLKEYLGETGYFAVYTMLFTVMLVTFQNMYQTVSESVQAMQKGIDVLTPVFTMALLLAGNIKTALGSYTLLLFAAQMTSFFILKIVFPCTYAYFVLQMLNFSMKEDRFSRLADVIRKSSIWIMRLLFGVITSLQVAQCLLLPVKDQARNSGFSRGLAAIPGFGSSARAMAGTMFDSAIVVKNAVGVAVIFFLLLFIFFPVIKILLFIFSYQLLSAAVQPVAEKRISGMISVLAKSVKTLFQGYITCAALFLISIAIITAATSVMS